MRARVAGVAAVLAAMTIGASADAGTAVGGLTGKVLRGPVQPVCVQDRPCEVAAAAMTLGFWRGGKEIARVRTGATGVYRIKLPPGVYSVRPAYSHPLWRLSPATVRVPLGRFGRVNFLLDTGLR
jgi:hypothetical protein